MKKLRILIAVIMVKLPPMIRSLLYTGRLRVVDGRRIDPEAEALGNLLKMVRDAEVVPTVQESRDNWATLTSRMEEPCPPDVVKREVTLTGAESRRPARVYRPANAGDAPLPTLLFFHGGGWVVGSIDSHDGMCGKLAAWAGIQVISFDYRLAPEHKFPAGLYDCVAAWEGLVAEADAFQADPTRLAMGGDSAGASLTTGVMHLLGERGESKPQAQLLIYPAVDARINSTSMKSLADAYVMPRETVLWFLDHYLPEGQDVLDPRLSALMSPYLADQPPALIIAAGQDPLWDDAFSYSKALQAAGSTAEVIPYEGQFHGFVSLTKYQPKGNDALKRSAQWLRDTLS